jgi:hypothetical protein
MVNYNIRSFAYAIIGLAFAIYIIIFLLTQNLSSIDFNNALSHISTAISINIILWVLFIKWGWKLKIFYSWLVPFPNISGDWKGIIKSNWNNEKKEIPVDIAIHQTFFNVQVQVKTEESRSYSIGASFDIDRGFQQLFYSYLNTPKATVINRSEIHYGSTLLYFNGFKVNELEGQYWTSRQTIGDIKLKRK